MRGTGERPPRPTLDVQPHQGPVGTPVASDDAPFGAVIGALLGMVISVPLLFAWGVGLVVLMDLGLRAWAARGK